MFYRYAFFNLLLPTAQYFTLFIRCQLLTSKTVFLPFTLYGVDYNASEDSANRNNRDSIY